MRVLVPPWLLVPLIGLAVAVLLGLGWWQFSRHLDKGDLEAAFAARTSAPPLSPIEARTLPPAELDFRRVRLEGRWDLEHALTIVSRFRNGVPGEERVAPLLLEGGVVLVNRGWYPLAERDRVVAALASERRGEVAGLARIEPGQGRRGDEGGWTGFDVVAMGETLPYETLAWGVIEGERLSEDPVTASTPLPVTGWRPFENTIPHLQYALTWWGLGAALLAMVAVRFATRRRQLTRPGAPETAARTSL